MSAHKAVLITGASRDLGQALAQKYLAQPHTIVVAATRRAGDADGLALLPKADTSRLVSVHFDVGSAEQVDTSLKALARFEVSALDVVIACGGAQSLLVAPVATVPPEAVLEHFRVNALGVLNLFQATWPMLQRGNGRKFVLLGSPIGSIAGMERRPVPMDAYGVSKAAAHYILRKAHVENADAGLVAFAVDPGFLQSRSGNAAARAFGMEQAPTSLDDSADFIVKTIEGATREETGGRFKSIEGEDCPW